MQPNHNFSWLWKFKWAGVDSVHQVFCLKQDHGVIDLHNNASDFDVA